MDRKGLKCLRCGAELKLLQETSLEARNPGIFMTQDWVSVEIYNCPACGKLEFYQPESEMRRGEIGTGFWWNWKYEPGSGPEMKCPQCGKQHPEDDAFCPGCGLLKKEVVSCRWCGKSFPADQEVCPHCGSRDPKP